VSKQSVLIAWSEPLEPNGVITSYRVAYGLHSSMQLSDDTVPSTRHDYQVTGLSAYQHYVFTLAAKTQSGWGAEASVMVYTVSYRSESIHSSDVIITVGLT